MKIKLLICFLTLFYLVTNAQDIPSWVNQHPINEFGYAGVGMAKTDEAGYMNKAKERALADLASEISIQISSSSLLNTIENDGIVKELYAETIRSTFQTDIEKFRLVDSWKNGEEYWVYYELNRLDYEEYIEKKRQKAIKDGFDFWYRGNTMIQQGNMTSGIDLLIKAWEVIQPVIHMELRCSYNGKIINLGTETYASLAGIFNGITLSVTPQSLNGQAFQGISDSIKVQVFRNGNPLRNIQLHAKFLSGDGDLSSPPPTDINGESVFYVKNITSKQEQQEIRVSLVMDTFKTLVNGKLGILFKESLTTLPEASLTVKLEKKQLNAYVLTTKDGLQTLATSMKSMLTNNYFNIVNSPSQADVIITLDNQLRKGGIIAGELYNMVEYFSTLSVRILNNRTNTIVLNYSLNDVRTLVPENKSKIQAETMAVRDLLKRLKKEFPLQLKTLTIDTEGNIPVKDYLPVSPEPVNPVASHPVNEDIPIVTPLPSVQPVQESQPAAEPNTFRENTVREEWIEGVYLEYSHLSAVGSKSRIHCKIINTTLNDVNIRLYLPDQMVINGNGEEMKVERITIGSNSGTSIVTSLIVPEIPTKLIIETARLDWVALLSLKKNTGETVKIRNLK